MADVLAGRNYVAREHRPGRERVVQRFLVLAIALLSLVLLGQLAYRLAIAPRLTIDTIVVDSNLPFTDEQLLALAGVHEGVGFFSVQPERVAARIRQQPIVRDVRVETVFPNRLTITATARVPLAAALARTDGGTVPLVFDEDGVVFQVGADAQLGDLPVLSGLRFAAVDVGLQLPTLVVDFLRQLRRIRVEDPALYRLFSEYRIVQKNEYAYEVVLYPMHYRLPVRIGTSIDADMIQYVMMMLDVLQREDRLSSLAELDFRSGEGVLRPRDDGGHR